MGLPEIDAWLRGGGLVVTASERAARAIADAFHRARRAEGLTAWPAPDIRDWKNFVRTAWEESTPDARLLLNPFQEQALWARIAGADGQTGTLLEGPRHRVATLAMEAHELLCSYAPALLKKNARSAWQQDSAAFSNWLAALDETCRAENLLSPARLPLELIRIFEGTVTEQAARPPLLLAGFDRILPAQRRLLDAWGDWRETSASEQTAQAFFYEAADAHAELNASALWCSRQLAANPRARLLVVTQDASARRGEIERAFLKHTGPSSLFEFSLGVPLGHIALAAGAHLLLRWLSGPLAEHELDWLFSTGYSTASPQESSALQAAMRKLRRRGLQRTSWNLRAFTSQRPIANLLPARWLNRVIEAERRLAGFVHKQQSPLDWAELDSQLLETAGWPGERPLTSAEFQALHRWQQVVEAAGSLGFDGRRISWREFLSTLSRALDETLFAPESRDASIQIAGPAESAGLTADAVWFLGAEEDSWPAGGGTHPLLPIHVQRETGMPHATPQLDWDLARVITTRLIAAAPEVHFSFARQREGAEARPSRLIAQLAGAPQELPRELKAPAHPQPLTISFEDWSRVPFPHSKVEGGANVLTSQSQCPFKAFATARLGADRWEPAAAGLTASQRGKLLHEVLHAVWAGEPEGIRSHAELRGLEDRQDRCSFVGRHARRAMQEQIPSDLRESMPARYLELEEQRLVRLVSEWLEYESTRIAFQVLETEAARTIPIAGLTLDLRLDRIDRLNDNSLLVIDYKSGNVHPKSWELPRPDDVQLPLYAGFALDPTEELGGLVFAKVRTGDLEFRGRLGDARATLLAGLTSGHGLVKNSFSAELLIDWRNYIEQLARDFLAGRPEVDPREYPKTCERCGLQTLCRVEENQLHFRCEDDPDEDAEADDE